MGLATLYLVERESATTPLVLLAIVLLAVVLMLMDDNE